MMNQLSAREMQTGNIDQTTIARLRDSLRKAEKVGDHGAAGDAAFNLATLLYQQGQDDDAIDLWNRAAHHYRISGRTSQLGDCLHMKGVVDRHQHRDSPFELVSLRVERFRHAWPIFAMSSMESPVHSERCTPGSARGVRKPTRG